jgi:hypothetical protein
MGVLMVRELIWDLPLLEVKMVLDQVLASMRAVE